MSTIEEFPDSNAVHAAYDEAYSQADDDTLAELRMKHMIMAMPELGPTSGWGQTYEDDSNGGGLPS